MAMYDVGDTDFEAIANKMLLICVNSGLQLRTVRRNIIESGVNDPVLTALLLQIELCLNQKRNRHHFVR